MPPTPPNEPTTSSRLLVLQHIDALCDRFEAAWQRGEPPAWDFEVANLSAADKIDLFKQYLRIELVYREHRGEVPDPEEYSARYPQYNDIISGVWLAKGVDASAKTLDPDERISHDRHPSAWASKSTSTRYHLLRSHAEGGLGRVDVARDQELQRDVAVKQLRNQYQGDSLAQLRFVREAQLTARLEHPGIVPIYGLGADQTGAPFYAMRFVNGETLRDAIARLHRLPGAWRDPEWVLELRKLLARFVSLCQAIHYAHSRGVIHRDLKPANILLGEFGETLVVDWGTAKVIGEPPAVPDAIDSSPHAESIDLTSPGVLVGTPAFMSPEQASVQVTEVGPATDVYGLGATLAALLTGQPPVTTIDPLDAIEQIRRGELTYPRDLLHSVPPALDAICRRALKRDPAERYSSARDVATDVELWLAGEPVTVWIEPWSQTLGRWIGRHRSLSLATAVVLVIGTGMAVITSRWADQERKRERLAGFVESIASANMAALPELARELQPFGSQGVDALKKRLDLAGKDEHAALNLRLALSSYGREYLDRLVEDLLRAPPEEFLTIRQLLHRHVPVLSSKLWKAWEQPHQSSDRQLRIAAALALYDSEHPRWVSIGDSVAKLLCREPSTWYGVWQAAFLPISSRLERSLCQLFDQTDNSALSRSAAELLGLLAEEHTELLVDLVQRATPAQLAPLIDGLARHQEQSIALLQAAVQDLRPVPVDHERVENQRIRYIDRDRRRARAACALLALNRPEDVRQWLEPSADPTFRSWVSELLPHTGINPEFIYRWWKEETHTVRRRSWLLMLGTLLRSAASDQQHSSWLQAIEEMERSEPDPGTHSAAQWVIGSWHRERPEQQSSQRAPLPYSPDRRWYEVKSGETFIIVQGPVEFLMGSPQDEYFRNPADQFHLRRIDHSWAIAAREVTYTRAADYIPNLARPPSIKASTEDNSAYRASWYDAARYCRRLSEDEGIPEDQMCFPPVDQIGPEMALPQDYLRRTGYRLPTQAEWEYSCRAGTVTRGYFGDDPELSAAYGWSISNSLSRVAPPAGKKPNELGLFDTLGNVLEWCYDRCEGLPYTSLPGWGRTVSDDRTQVRIAPRRTYSVRGGDVNSIPAAFMSAARSRLPAGTHDATVGFRPVRTLPPDWQPFDIVRVLGTPASEVRYRIIGNGQPFTIEDVEPNVVVEPQSGVAPVEIQVRSRKSDSQRFHFTLVQSKTGYRRTVTGQVTHLRWKVKVHPVMQQPSLGDQVRATSLIRVVQPLQDGGLTLQQSSDMTEMSDELTFDRTWPPQKDDAQAEKPPIPFAVLATAEPSLLPGEYYIQVHGHETLVVNAEHALDWDRSFDITVPGSGIDATLRASIWNTGESLQADVFSSTGKAQLWVNVRPAPTLP